MDALEVAPGNEYRSGLDGRLDLAEVLPPVQGGPSDGFRTDGR